MRRPQKQIKAQKVKVSCINSRHQNKQNKTKAALPLISGAAAFGLTYGLAEIPFLIFEEKTDKFLHLNKNESEIINAASKKAFESAGLKKAGAKFISVPTYKDGDSFDVLEEASKLLNKAKKTEADMALIDTMLDSEPPKNALGNLIDNFGKFLDSKKGDSQFLNKVYRILYGDIDTFYDLDSFAALKAGDGAFYVPYKRTVFVPEDGCNLAAFHETGHAINDNLSKTGRFLQHAGDYSKLAAGGIIIASLLAKEQNENNEKNPVNKALNLIKNNAGKLIFLAYTPQILEEGLASYRGEKLAKNLLDEKLFKKLKTANRIALSTYIIAAGALAVSGTMAVKAKDFVSAKLNKSKKAFFTEENGSTDSTKS